MRQINLDGTFFEIKDDITKRRISPWMAKIASAGSKEYSDFSQAQMEEYFDFRNGIGKKRAGASDARLEFSEGIDFTTEGQAVLGPKVTTAGTGGDAFGVAPVKILDFDGATYAIGDDRIKEWESTKWTSRETGLSDPLDAIVVTDDTDEYIIASSATKVMYSTDGTTWTKFEAFGDSPDFTTYAVVNTNSKLTVTATKITAVNADTDNDHYVYIDKTTNAIDWLDVDFTIRIESASENNAVGGMAISNTVGSYDDFVATDISVLIKKTAGSVYKIHLVRGDFVADDSYTCSVATPYYCTLKRTAASATVTCEIYSNASRTALVDTLSVAGFSTTKYRYVYGFVGEGNGAGGEDFDGYVENLSLNSSTVGYMADYANRLYLISTDGKNIYYSASKNIDAAGDGFTLTGNFGTVYSLFEGKLLADGTPTLYFTCTKGLYSLDATNEIAYKQEVEYPPLTYAGHAGMYWNGSVWVSTGYGILKVTPSMATYVGPDLDDGLPATYQGSVFDMITVNNWLVYCVNKTLSTDKSSILKRNASYGGNLQVYTTATADVAITCLHHTASSDAYPNGRLWFGEGTDVKYMEFPDTTSNVKQLSTYVYVDDSGYGKLPIFRKLANISKVALGVSCITKSCDSSEYVEVYYGLNGVAPTNLMGTFNDSPRDTIATFGSGLGEEFYTIQFAIKLLRATANTTNSPELESLLFYYMPTPTRISGWIFNVLATGEDGEAIFTAFETIYDKNTLVAFYPSGDTGKTSYNVKLTQMPSREWWENQGGKEGYFTVSVEEIFKG